MSAPAPDRARGPRAPRPQAVLTVQHTRWLSPHLVRVRAGGPGMAAFRDNDFTDKYVKIVFVDPALGLEPPYDLAVLRESLPPEDRPVTRTYTVRRADVEAEQLDIDFVVHGDEGLAGPWAARAQPGDVLVLSGAGGAYAPDASCDWHLLVGDSSALPAISSALEALPADARGLVLLETEDDSPDVPAPSGVEVRRVHNPAPGTRPTALAEALAEVTWATGRVGVFVHGEREAVKAVRAALKPHDEAVVQRSISGYWAHGRTEDRFQAEKREPIGKIED